MSELMQEAQTRFEQPRKKQRLFTAFDYAAGSRRRLRWVIAKAEHAAKGANSRLVVTSIVGGLQ